MQLCGRPYPSQPRAARLAAHCTPRLNHVVGNNVHHTSGMFDRDPVPGAGLHKGMPGIEEVVRSRVIAQVSPSAALAD